MQTEIQAAQAAQSAEEAAIEAEEMAPKALKAAQQYLKNVTTLRAEAEKIIVSLPENGKRNPLGNFTKYGDINSLIEDVAVCEHLRPATKSENQEGHNATEESKLSERGGDPKTASKDASVISLNVHLTFSIFILLFFGSICLFPISLSGVI